MAILPLNLARVSNLLRSNSALQSIESTQAQLMDVQNQLSTGKRVNSPSDDPAAAATIMTLQKLLERRKAYASNIRQASSQLGEVDSTLGDLSELVQQAQNIASANVGSDVTDAQRRSAAAVAQTLFAQAKTIGNKQFNGMYLFAGDKATDAPFKDVNGGVEFVGSTTLLQNTFDESTNLNFQVSGARVFGALATRVSGAANLTPALTAQTRLADLNGATNAGVTPGAIQISDGTTSKTIDLSNADTLSDVITAINAAGVGTVSASLTSMGIQLAAGTSDNISVANVSGTTASDLGLNTAAGGAGAGNTVAGAAISPRLTLLTPLSTLRNGLGLDLAGLTITNGTTSKTLPLPSGGTVETLLNTINGAGVGVSARINASSDGIDILNATQGTQLIISENGGQTATQLGVRSFSPITALSELNNGQGVRTAQGADFQVTRRNGTSFQVDIDGANTVQDVLNRINAADGGAGLTASFASTGNGIVLTDTTTGPGTLGISALNFSQSVQDLGLQKAASGNTITGSDVNPVKTPGLIGNLHDLVTALQGSDQAGITAAAMALQADYDRVVQIRGQTGAREKELTNRQDRLENENTAAQSLLSQSQDTDFAAAITRFQQLQTALQATLQATAKVQGLSLMDFLG